MSLKDIDINKIDLLPWISFICIVILFVTTHAHADSQIMQEIGFRYNNIATSNGLFDWSPESSGKLIELKYSISPWGHSDSLAKHFYMEVAGGQYYANDFLDSHASTIIEASPGLQVQAGPVVVKVSQGVSNLPIGNQSMQYVTHLGVNLLDSMSGMSIGLERTHFSSGNALGLDFTGINVGIRF